MEPRRGAAATSAVSVLAALLLVGCTGGTEGDPGPEPSVSTPYVPPESDPPPDPGCEADLPGALSFRPETPEEAALNAYLSGCTDGSRTRIVVSEESPVPWVVDRPDYSWREGSDDVEVAILRQAVQGMPGLVIAPGETVDFDDAPQDLHLVLTAESAFAWYSLRKVTEQVRTKAEDRVVDVLSDGRPARKAALTCGLQGAEFGSTVSDTDTDGGSAADRLTATLGLGQAGAGALQTCSRAIDDAERQLAQNEPSRLPVVTLDDALAASARERPGIGEVFTDVLRRSAQSVRRL